MTLEYTIDVQQVEHLQTIGDTDALEQMFERARRTVIGGGVVLLVRVSPSGEVSRFDELGNESDLEAYRTRVFKYLH
ncbi:hypothetical protein SAMN05444008_110127 [Cnuella takakiae]|uniref:Uncharacterized protein n=1 Tax=Cnuella takakiae TaxID=1302690 RepID=A0A1M5D8X9_9BACT|nr:hypothetical protein [Cnuella takakiae]OLY94064.1 hypothetical protein BUE76_20840 [Cnuella takakiae]SHF63483.1 hypothetical protein SAMN05444008_110127 [Cnuella takakiae]